MVLCPKAIRYVSWNIVWNAELLIFIIYLQNLALLLIFAFSLSIHEYSHACAAFILGDSTAKDQGRLTLNPLKHIDLLGTLIFPLLIGFGWAKPVPVAENNLLNKRRSLYIVALAGPLSNIIISILFSIFFHITDNQLLGIIFQQIAAINVILAIFNLFPIPPLDGSNIIYSFLSDKKAFQYNIFIRRYGLLSIILIYFIFRTYPQIIIAPLSIILSLLGLI